MLKIFCYIIQKTGTFWKGNYYIRRKVLSTIKGICLFRTIWSHWNFKEGLQVKEVYKNTARRTNSRPAVSAFFNYRFLSTIFLALVFLAVNDLFTYFFPTLPKTTVIFEDLHPLKHCLTETAFFRFLLFTISVLIFDLLKAFALIILMFFSIVTFVALEFLKASASEATINCLRR